MQHIEDGLEAAAADADTAQTTADTAQTTAAAAIAKALIDAKGDLIVGTAADTAARKAVGANGKVLRGDSTQSDGLLWAYPPGYEFDAATVTSNVTIAATSEASQTTIVAGASVAYDGTTTVIIEFSCPRVVLETSANSVAVFDLYEDTTLLARIVVLVNNGEATGALSVPVYGRIRRTPSNASHSYTVKAHSSTGAAVAQAGTGSGGSGTNVPILLTVKKA